MAVVKGLFEFFAIVLFFICFLECVLGTSGFDGKVISTIVEYGNEATTVKMASETKDPTLGECSFPFNVAATADHFFIEVFHIILANH